MKVKRFVAPDMRHGLMAVREALGPEAIILSNKRISKGVEILATLEAVERPEVEPAERLLSELDSSFDDEAAVSAPAAVSPLELEVNRMENQARARAEAIQASLRKRTARPQVESEELSLGEPQFRAQSVAVEPAVPVSRAVEQEQLASMQRQLEQMRELLEGRLLQQGAVVTPEATDVPVAVKQLGLQQDAVRHIGAGSPLPVGTTLDELIERLGTQLASDATDPVATGGIFALVGPTGAGKTTTIAKLAARHVMRHGADSVALVSLDVFRIGGGELLMAMGRILGVAVRVVRDLHELPRVLDQLRDKHLVLIDTAGISRSQPESIEQLRLLAELEDRVVPLLAVNATSQYQVLYANYHDYQLPGLAGAVITKVDESYSLGEALSLLLKTNLPVMYVTDGQDVPRNIRVASTGYLIALIRHLLKGNASSQVSQVG